MKAVEYTKPRIESIRVGDVLASLGPARAFLYGGGGGGGRSGSTLTIDGQSGSGSGNFSKF